MKPQQCKGCEHHIDHPNPFNTRRYYCGLDKQPLFPDNHREDGTLPATKAYSIRRCSTIPVCVYANNGRGGRHYTATGKEETDIIWVVNPENQENKP
jgi:hypothetical protein